MESGVDAEERVSVTTTVEVADGNNDLRAIIALEEPNQKLKGWA